MNNSTNACSTFSNKSYSWPSFKKILLLKRFIFNKLETKWCVFSDYYELVWLIFVLSDQFSTLETLWPCFNELQHLNSVFEHEAPIIILKNLNLIINTGARNSSLESGWEHMRMSRCTWSPSLESKVTKTWLSSKCQ